MTFARGRLSLFLDGELIFEETVPLPNPPSGTWKLGGSGWAYNGDLDEVMVFDRAITVDEAKALHRRSLLPPAPSLTAQREGRSIRLDVSPADDYVILYGSHDLHTWTPLQSGKAKDGRATFDAPAEAEHQYFRAARTY